jgi:hypothetical protein
MQIQLFLWWITNLNHLITSGVLSWMPKVMFVAHYFFYGFHIAFLTVFYHAPSLGLLSFSSLSNVGILFLAFFLPLVHFCLLQKKSLICPQCGVWSWSGFLLKRIFYQAQNGIANDIFPVCWAKLPFKCL